MLNPEHKQPLTDISSRLAAQHNSNSRLRYGKCKRLPADLIGQTRET